MRKNVLKIQLFGLFGIDSYLTYYVMVMLLTKVGIDIVNARIILNGLYVCSPSPPCTKYSKHSVVSTNLLEPLVVVVRAGMRVKTLGHANVVTASSQRPAISAMLVLTYY